MADGAVYQTSFKLPYGVNATAMLLPNGTFQVTVTDVPLAGTITWNSGIAVICKITGEGATLALVIASDGLAEAIPGFNALSTTLVSWGCTKAMQTFSGSSGGGGGLGAGLGGGGESLPPADPGKTGHVEIKPASAPITSSIEIHSTEYDVAGNDHHSSSIDNEYAALIGIQSTANTHIL